MKITIDVTQEDIDLGCRAEPYGENGGCMVWRALSRATEGALDGLVVGTYGADFNVPGGYQTIRFSDQVSDRIRDFDSGRAVEPFSFDIDLPIDPAKAEA